MNPADIEAYLRARVVGQDAACRALAVAAVKHLRRRDYSGEVRMGKSNVLLLGPTGVGKTYMVRALAECVDAPFVSIAATAMTEAGFVGLDPDYPLRRLVQRYGKERATRGIVYVDEVDKIARRSSDDQDKGKHPTGIGLQQALLDIIDAGVLELSSVGSFDASGVLFVMSGAFVGLERTIEARIAGARGPRPSTYSPGELLRQVEPRDLVAYGLIPELVGRLPVIVPLRALTVLELVRILREPADSPLRRMQVDAELAGATLEFEEPWLHEVAREAIGRGQGARDLLAVLETHLRPAFAVMARGERWRVLADGSLERTPAAATDGAEAPGPRAGAR